MMPKIFPILLLLYCCFSCDTHPQLPAVFTQNVMTIDYRILIGSKINSVKRREIQFLIDQTFEEIDTIFNKWNPDSEISALNSLKADESVPLSPHLYSFLKRIEPLV